MCWSEYDGNYRNALTHTLDRPSYIGLEVLSLIVALLVKTALIKTIIPLSKKLSIVFVRYPRNIMELRSRIESLALDGEGEGDDELCKLSPSL